MRRRHCGVVWSDLIGAGVRGMGVWPVIRESEGGQEPLASKAGDGADPTPTLEELGLTGKPRRSKLA